MQYEVLNETEKALHIEYFYWHPVGETKKKNVQKSFSFWIPKTQATELHKIQSWFLLKVSEYNKTASFYKEISLKNIQHGIAPEREKFFETVVCPVKEEKRGEYRTEFANTYFPGVSWWMIGEVDAREEDLYDEWKALVNFDVSKKVTKYRDIK